MTAYIINHQVKGVITIQTIDQLNMQFLKIEYNRYNILWKYK